MKITRYEQMFGLDNTINFLRSKVHNKTLPQFILFWGLKGTGKSSLARLLAIDLLEPTEKEKSTLLQSVVINNKSVENLSLYNLSSLNDEDIDTVIADISPSFNGRPKVIILDEAHRVSKKALDKLLEVAEYIPKGVYVILITTDINSLSAPVIDRAVKFQFDNPSTDTQRKLINDLIEKYNLHFNVPKELVIRTILRYTNSPRSIVNTIEAIKKEGMIEYDTDIVPLTGDVKDSIMPKLFEALHSPTLQGLQFIHDINIKQDIKHEAIEALRVALGGNSWELSAKDIAIIRELEKTYGSDRIFKFVQLLLSSSYVTKEVITGIYLQSVNFKVVAGTEQTSKEEISAKDLSVSRKIANLKNKSALQGDPELKGAVKPIDNFLDVLEAIEE